MNQGVDDPHAANDVHRYPFAGAENPRVRLGVVSIPDGDGETAGETQEPIWFDAQLAAPFGDDFYLARVDWSPAGWAEGADGPVLLAQVQSRDQSALAVVQLNPHTGEGTTLFTERSESWVNLHDIIAFLDGGELLWASEADGWCHLHVRSAADGSLVRRLTEGAWHVDVSGLIAVDAAADGFAYFLGNPQRAILPPGGESGGASDGGVDALEYAEQHLFRVRLDGSSAGRPERLTRTAGFHAGVTIAHDRSMFVTQFSSVTEPMTACLVAVPPPASPEDPVASTAQHWVSAKAGTMTTLHSARALDPRVEALGRVLSPPRFETFRSTDGAVTLQACLYLPDPSVHGDGPYPTVVSCYGGPHVQFVQNSWGRMAADLSSQMLRSEGFLVLKVDNRGSDRRGLAFEAAVRANLGAVEVDDQVACVKHAVTLGLCDPARVGIMGWSYGGYLSAMCLAKAPDTFRCAVAGAPVTHWDGYDTHYTERYMGGTPSTQPEAYAQSSVMAHVDHIEGALLLIHGLMDENVHFRHTARLVQALTEHQKAYELLTFPNERHSPRSLKDRTFMEQRVFAFLDKWLRAGD